MNPTNAFGVLSGTESLKVDISSQDILLVSVGIFLAMLLALIIAQNI